MVLLVDILLLLFAPGWVLPFMGIGNERKPGLSRMLVISSSLLDQCSLYQLLLRYSLLILDLVILSELLDLQPITD